MTETDDILSLSHVGKSFRTGFTGRRVEAVRDVSLTLRRGESLGYLGPNGSGKTTSIKCILGLIRPTAGQIRLFGRDPSDPRARAKVGYLAESPYFYDYLTASEVLDYVGKLFGMAASDRKKRVPMLLDRLGLGHAMHRPLRGFSKGMLQRVGIAQSLLADPELLVFDEPLSGLDPVGRKEVRDLMMELRQEGRSLFFSSHVLGDIETLCDAVCILDRGVAVAQGRLQDLLRPDALESEALLQLPAAPEAQAAARTALLAVEGTVDGGMAAGAVRIWVPQAQVPALTQAALQSGAVLRALAPRRDSLEELFLRKAVHVQEGKPQASSQAAP